MGTLVEQAHLPRGPVRLAENAEEARHVEAQDNVAVADRLVARVSHVERVIRGDARASLGLGGELD